MTQSSSVDTLNEAIRVYIGFGFRAEPAVYFERVVERFGAELAWRLRPDLEEVVQELLYVEPCLREDSQNADGIWAASIVGAIYPFLDEKARAALAWLWSHNNA